LQMESQEVLEQLCAEASEDDDYVQVPRVSDATASMAGRSSRRWADNDYGSAAQPLGVDAAILRAGKLSLRAVTLALVCAALAVMTLSSTERLGHPGGSGWQLSFGSGVLELVDDMWHEKQTSGLLILVPCPTFMTLLRSQNYHGETPKAAKMDAPKVEAKVVMPEPDPPVTSDTIPVVTGVPVWDAGLHDDTAMSPRLEWGPGPVM
jgi:hypothetical protein